MVCTRARHRPLGPPDPPEGLVPFERAVHLALTRILDADVGTRWSSAAVRGAPSAPLPTDPDWAGGSLYEDHRQRPVDASPEALWSIIEGIGGTTGWYSFPLAWRVRGLLDRAVGGVGLRRGRRDPTHLFVGESLDFWRVEERVPGQLLRLRAEMRLPGLAWLELDGRQGRRTTGRRTSSAPSSTRAACRGTPTGGRWRRSTASCSASMARNIARAAEELERAERRSGGAG